MAKIISAAGWVVVLGLATNAFCSAGRVALDQEFLSPPDSSRPWCYWWWLNGNASREGITRDFEEMKRQGIGGALLFDAGEADVNRGPAFMSAAWRALFRHALKEADRCGIVLTVNLCSGWNCGGPWVTPEHAAQKLVSAETMIKGPGRVSVALPRPPAVKGFYREVAVLAMPAPGATPESCTLTASSQFENYGPALAEDGKDDTRWISNGNKPGLGPTPAKPEYLQFTLAAPSTATAIRVRPYPDCSPKDVEVQASADGKTFRTLKRVTLKPKGEQTVSFAPATATHFRAVFLSTYPYQGQENWNVQVSEIALLRGDQVVSRSAAGTAIWRRDTTLNLTPAVNQDGRLVWEAPAGNWRVLRIGCTLHGKTLSCVGSGPTGLEIDPLSAAAMDAHFAETGAKLLADAGPLAGKTLQYFHIDSWEIGQPTWTPRMREEFRQRRGYDPLPFLPAVLGRIVDSPEATTRFLQDYRRTVADLVAANYYGRLEELSVQGGLLGTHPESGGPFFDHWIDALECLGRTAVPMGEFWKRNSEPDGPITWHNNPSPKQAASAAHIYGKPVCQAEAYTSFAEDWIDNPWNMKDLGDAACCEGLTRQVLCFWVHQPRLDAKPGFQWTHVGTHFDPNLTWWPMSAGWLKYIARCQHLLRQGLFVADFAYLQSETIPSFLSRPGPKGFTPRPGLVPPLPAGCDYDALNAEALMTRAAARNGRLALPDGMSYRYLVLPHETNAMLSPATVKKINALAAAGVSVIGPPSFAGAIPRLRVAAPDAAVRADGLEPDIEFRSPTDRAQWVWIHRRAGGTDIYFLSNQAAAEASATVAFRAAGRQPELWDAVTGTIRDLPEFRAEPGRPVVPLQFAPRQSWFVVFRKRSQEPGVRSRRNFPALKPVMELTGPWEVQFDPQWFYPDHGTGGKIRFERLTDWTRRPEDAIKYYSGIATYHITFEPPIQNPKAGILFDLGQVRDVARVKLNGRDLGVVWTAPWQVEIPDGLLKPGGNALEIAVANLWPNRLTGDATLPKEQRRTITNARVYEKKCADAQTAGRPPTLMPSGLLGPVRLLVAE